MTGTDFKPDLDDQARCISVHWSLPVQCERPRSHRENWHETTNPGTGSRLRYRHPGKLTEELRSGTWHTLPVPIGEARIKAIREFCAGWPVIEELLGEVARLTEAHTADTPGTGRMTPQSCPAASHMDWAAENDFNHPCPWCENETLTARISDYRYYLAELRSYIRHLERAHGDTEVDALRRTHVAPAELLEFLAGSAVLSQAAAAIPQTGTAQPAREAAAAVSTTSAAREGDGHSDGTGS